MEEEDPSEEYVRAYNDGYQLAKYEPELLETLLKSDDQDQSISYLKAMEQGKDQYEHEKMLDEMREIRQKKTAIKRRIK